MYLPEKIFNVLGGYFTEIETVRINNNLLNKGTVFQHILGTKNMRLRVLSTLS